MMIKVVGVLFLLLPVNLWAWNEVGNGGKAIVCYKTIKKKNIRQASLLDFYEARKQENIKLTESRYKSKKEKQILAEILKKLEAFAPDLSRQYQKRLKLFWGEVSYLEEVSLTPIKDSFHLIKPKSPKCKVEQAAIYRKKTKNKKKFLIDKEIWQKMDAFNKAGLVLHEIIYEHLYIVGEKNSIKARKLTSLLFSQDFLKMNKDSFWKALKRFSIPIYRKS